MSEILDAMLAAMPDSYQKTVGFPTYDLLAAAALRLAETEGALETAKTKLDPANLTGAELDAYIEKYAKGWRFERISLVASAIMRVAMFEILYMPDIPHGVAINEAVTIAKKYDAPEVAKFVNGILGSFLREEVKE